MTQIKIGPLGPVECPACKSETTFWVQANKRAMCPCSARRTYPANELSDGAAARGTNGAD